MFIELTKVDRFGRETNRESKILINVNQITEMGELEMGDDPPLSYIRNHGGLFFEIKETYEEIKKLIMGAK